MSDSTKTISFVAVAGVLALTAFVVDWSTRTGQLPELESVGQPFFKDFVEPAKAATLEITAKDQVGELKSFVIRKSEGQWVIPSHYNYPAEATERLAATATGLIGLKREALAGRFSSQHERFGVLDPNDSENGNVAAAGQRITMRDGDDNVLIDLIIGNKAERSTTSEGFGPVIEDTDYENQFYVRRADENQTFKANIDLDISTDFNDWIEPDLLKIGEHEVTEIKLDNYRLVEESFQTPMGIAVQYAKEPGELVELFLNEEMASWSLAGLDEETEIAKSIEISGIAEHLPQIEIKGVRPKYQFNGQPVLTPDLSLNIPNALRQNPQQAQALVQELQSDLLDKGFDIARDPQSGGIVLTSTRGELVAQTDVGVQYVLNFGEILFGEESEIEIGGSAESVDVDGETTNSDANNLDGSEAEATNSQGDESSEDQDRNRYLMVRVNFMEDLVKIPLAPIEPIAPEKPEGYDDWDGPAEELVGGAEEADPQEADQDGAPEPPPEVTEELAAQQEAFQKYRSDLSVYLAAQDDFPAKQQSYEEELREYQEKMRQGKQLAQRLNERFADWYYVIADESFDKLHKTRADLVDTKEPVEIPESNLPTDNGMPSANELEDMRPRIDFENEKQLDQEESGDDKE